MRRNIVLTIFLLLLACSDSGSGGSGFSILPVNMNKLKDRAIQGDVQAQYELGSMYCCGSRRNDLYEATKWLCKAARANNAEAQKKVGWIYSQRAARELKHAKSYDDLSDANLLALTWYSMVSKGGDKSVDPFIREMAVHLSWNDAQKADYYIGQYPNIPCETSNNYR